jgi:hypothetical protein
MLSEASAAPDLDGSPGLDEPAAAAEYSGTRSRPLAGLLGARPKAGALDNGPVRGFFEAGRRPPTGDARLLRTGDLDLPAQPDAASVADEPAAAEPEAAPQTDAGGFGSSSRVTAGVLGRSDVDETSTEVRV